ncbi:MAG: sensor hybrid histidine kinase [Phycisphaerales bacterium]|nr:sensor hybrid histidine kinase [Phycisphaerales bacterium]
MSLKKTLCVLAVETDQSFNRSVLLSFLQREGYRVLYARTAGAALALAATGECDLIVSDTILPNVSGLNLMHALKARHGLKGIAMMNEASAKDIADAKAAGFDRIVPKPLNEKLLRIAIEELTAAPPAPD